MSEQDAVFRALASVLMGGAERLAIVLATLDVPASAVPAAAGAMMRAAAIVAWANENDRLDALERALVSSFPLDPEVRALAERLDEAQRMNGEHRTTDAPSLPTALPPWGKTSTTHHQEAPPERPALAERPASARDVPWFTAYHPTWVLRRVSFTLHVHVVPQREELDAIDRAARAAIAAPYNPARRVEGVALHRGVRAGEALTAAVDGDGVTWSAAPPQVWRGERVKLTLRGVVEAATTAARHVLVLRVLARSATGVDEVLGEADLALTVEDRAPFEQTLRVGAAAASALATAALLIGSTRFGLPAALGGAGGATSLAIGAFALRPVLAPPLPPAALESRGLDALPPARCDPEALTARIERSCAHLTGPRLERARDALAGAFPSYAALDQLTAADLGTPLAHVAPPGPLPDVAFKLLRWCGSRGTAARLVAAAAARRGDHPALAALVAELSAAPGGA